MARVSTYWHTLRYLKPIQIYGRIWFRIRRPRIDRRPAPPLRPPCGRAWASPAQRRQSLFGTETFNFLNVQHALSDVGWDSPDIPKLWRYNLHYFDDLNATDAVQRVAAHTDMLKRWTHENQPGEGTGWEPYPTSLRIVNWIKWSLHGNALPVECIQSLAVQARWLQKRLEIHLLGNHLLANAKALVFAGLFFEGPDAGKWLERGSRILRQQLDDQILRDGGHFELSPMYHALVLEDLLDLYNLTATFGRTMPSYCRQLLGDIEPMIGKMRAWLAAMCHPDNQISFFNDAAIGIAPSPEELEGYARRLRFPELNIETNCLLSLPDSGYVRIERDDAVVLLDVGQIGPDHLPAHAHADTLSFELSISGQRVFVNSGTSCYENSAERLRQRGTASHNTVAVDGHDSSEVWNSFRVGRRAYPCGLSLNSRNSITVSCAHDGFRRLRRGGAVHRREWEILDGALRIEDTVTGHFEHAQAQFFVHPSIRVEATPDGLSASKLSLRLPSGRPLFFSVEGGRLSTRAACWHPEFGTSIRNTALIVEFAKPVKCVRAYLKWRDSN